LSDGNLIIPLWAVSKNNMDYIFGAYYLIKLRKLSDGGLLYSPTSCFNEILPHNFVLFGEKMNRKKLKQLEEIYTGSVEEMAKWCFAKNDENTFGLEATFSSLETAIEFRERFCKDQSSLVILGIYLHRSYYDSLLRLMEDERNASNPKRLNDLFDRLKQQRIEDDEGVTLGYDLLETFYGGVHSFQCESPETVEEIKNRVKINEFGLIDSCEEAASVSELTLEKNEVWKI
jgi:hypothetical protein